MEHIDLELEMTQRCLATLCDRERAETVTIQFVYNWEMLHRQNCFTEKAIK
jgi:hypothetical protein